MLGIFANILHGCFFPGIVSNVGSADITPSPGSAENGRSESGTGRCGIMSDILADPVKTIMLVILIAMEVPAAVFMIWQWIKANKERDKE